VTETVHDDPFPPLGIDLSKPSVARIYDYFLGGTANWTIDREFADKIIASFPLVRPIALANRLFLHRAVRHLVGLGVRQFVDIGAGVPTMGHTHAVADELSSDSRVVYIDSEPVAVAHSTILLEQHGDLARHAAIQGDLRDPDGLWERVAETGIIDFSQPIGLLTIAVLHFAQPGPDGVDLGPNVLARYRELLPSGSYLALSHASVDGAAPDAAAGMNALKASYDKAGNPVIWRTKDEVRELFGDFELLEPGIDWTPAWHPEESGPNAPLVELASPNESAVLAGIGRKP
jgi:hypothetical protein